MLVIGGGSDFENNCDDRYTLDGIVLKSDTMSPAICEAASLKVVRSVKNWMVGPLTWPMPVV